MLPSVDLPAPLGPMMAWTSPGFTSSVRPLRISRPATVAWRFSILSMSGIQFVDVGYALSVRTARSEEHTSELQSLMRISYAVFCLKKKNTHNDQLRWKIQLEQ